MRETWFSHCGTIGVGAGFPESAFRSPRNVELEPRRKSHGRGWRGSSYSGCDNFTACRFRESLSTPFHPAMPSTSARWQSIGAGLVLTRIVLLAHWTSDVIAGLAIGAAVERMLRHWTGFGLSRRE
jgi:hypothetical protein